MIYTNATGHDFAHTVDFMPKQIEAAWQIIGWCSHMFGHEEIDWRYDWWPGKCPYRWWFKSQDHALQFQLTWGGVQNVDPRADN